MSSLESTIRWAPDASTRRIQVATAKWSSSSGRLASADLSGAMRKGLFQPDVSDRNITRSGSSPRDTTFFQPFGVCLRGGWTIVSGGCSGSGNMTRWVGVSAAGAGLSQSVSPTIRKGPVTLMATS